MPNEGAPKSPELPPIFEIDISEGWDTASQREIFLRELRKLPFYKPNLLYSGFDAKNIGVTSSSKELNGIIFAEKEEAFNEDRGSSTNNPWHFAMENQHPAFAVYDPQYLERASIKDSRSGFEEILHDGYKVTGPKALIAIIKL